MTKKCNKCSLIKDLSEFTLHLDKKTNKRYPRSECKACRVIINSAYSKANPNVIANARLKRDYGITLEQYNHMFNSQLGCCAICSIHSSLCDRPLVVDHCHATNKVRSLLCDNCNKGIGFFKENIDILNKAIKYVKNHN